MLFGHDTPIKSIVGNNGDFSTIYKGIYKYEYSPYISEFENKIIKDKNMPNIYSEKVKNGVKLFISNVFSKEKAQSCSVGCYLTAAFGHLQHFRIAAGYVIFKGNTLIRDDQPVADEHHFQIDPGIQALQLFHSEVMVDSNLQAGFSA